MAISLMDSPGVWFRKALEFLAICGGNGVFDSSAFARLATTVPLINSPHFEEDPNLLPCDTQDVSPFRHYGLARINARQPSPSTGNWARCQATMDTDPLCSKATSAQGSIESCCVRIAKAYSFVGR
jgi:hypothetical protein